MSRGRHAADLEDTNPCAGVLDRPFAGTPGRTPVEALERLRTSEASEAVVLSLVERNITLADARDGAVDALEFGVCDRDAREAAYRLLTGRELALAGDRP